MPFDRIFATNAGTFEAFFATFFDSRTAFSFSTTAVVMAVF